MNVYRIGPPPQWWGPKLSPWIVKGSSNLRKRMMRSKHRVLSVDVEGQQRVRRAMDNGCGVLILPNHPSHADPFVIYQCADQLATPIYIMATWHVFDSKSLFGKWMLQKHGCFSVDRDAADRRALKEAIRILQTLDYPLVIFPEGEIYHCNDCVTTFLEGPASIALSAARKSEREIVVIPCGIKYRYQDDPSQELQQVMMELEQRILWRPRTEGTLKDRIYHFSEAILSLKEIEYLGESFGGPLPERVNRLAESILERLESQRQIPARSKSIPERVKEIRRRCVTDLNRDDQQLDEAAETRVYTQLNDAFFVGQLFSYPGNYVAQSPTMERMAETIDKFEEDVLQRSTAGIRGSRVAKVSFGEPISISNDRTLQPSAAELTRQFEASVQDLVDNENAC